MSTQDQGQGGWDDETLVDKLDVSVQLLQVLDDLFQLKVQSGEGLSKEEVARAATVLEVYIKDYQRARNDWIKVVS